MAIQLNRRTFLRGTVMGAGTAIALPILDSMLNNNGTAFAHGSPLPRRFGIWWWGNGVRPERWHPSEEGPNWALTDELQPLAALKDDISIVTGYDNKIDGTVHHAGHGGMLAGAPLQGDAGSGTSTMTAPTIDVLVASDRLFRGSTPWDALRVGVVPAGGSEGTIVPTLSHNAPNSVNPEEFSHTALYARLFGERGVDPGVAQRRLAARRSALDAVTEDIAALQQVAGANDRARLEQHFESIRALETQIEGTASVDCAAPTTPSDEGELSVRSDTMADLIKVALACDLTRVVVFRFDTWYAPVFSELGHQLNQHALTHDEGGDQPQVHESTVFVMERLAHFLQGLRDTPEGAGTILDNSAILATTEVSLGKNHARSDMPVVLAGRAGGGLQTGFHHRSPSGQSTSRIHLSLLQSLGLPMTAFGAGNGYTDRTIPQLLA